MTSRPLTKCSFGFHSLSTSSLLMCRQFPFLPFPLHYTCFRTLLNSTLVVYLYPGSCTFTFSRPFLEDGYCFRRLKNYGLFDNNSIISHACSASWSVRSNYFVLKDGSTNSRSKPTLPKQTHQAVSCFRRPTWQRLWRRHQKRQAPQPCGVSGNGLPT